MLLQKVKSDKTKAGQQIFVDFSALGVDNIPLNESVIENMNSTRRVR